ncbi:MAG TPA: VWA domain-containing protein [Trueperaceae bacterium]
MARTTRILKSALLALCLLLPAATAAAQGPVYIQLILDASGSMWNKLADGRYRIVAAKDVLTQLVSSLPDQEGLNVGLRVYGANFWASDPGACEDSQLVVPMEGVDRERLLATVRETEALGATPIALSLELAAQDFPADGRKVIVLITDGIESCRSDLREVAERLRQQGIDIDLRIIGIDLDASARAAFEGLGTFENATSAAELLGALNRAVEVAPAEATYPVTVTLTREGAPATEGATVEFVSAVTDERYPFAAGDAAGEFTADLPAGAYAARVADAFSGEPLTFAGLTVTEGENAFAFELAPRAEVTLTVADERPAAGSSLTVSFEGAPDGHGEVWLAPADAGDDVWLTFAYVEGPAGEAELRVPEEPGAYEARYVLPLPEGGYEVVGRAAFEAQAVTASVSAPAEAVGGNEIEVAWEGPDNPGDFITVVPAGAAEGAWTDFAYTATGSPARVSVPEEPGEYEVRYVTGQSNKTLASTTIVVTEATASVSAPAQVMAGAEVEVTWTGPNNSGDYITIAPAGSREGTYLDYEYTTSGSPLTIRAPDEPGDYEVRYVTGQSDSTLAMAPIEVTAATATVAGPAEVVAGSPIEVTWTGPDNSGDYITVAPAGSPEGTYLEYDYTASGSPLTIRAPEEPGEYEIRYVTGQSASTLASAPITVVPATASLSAPSEVAAGERFDVTWEGPGNSGDYITVAPAGSPEGTYLDYVYASGSGATVSLRAPDEPGQYEVRYVTGRQGHTLASFPVTVR